MTLPYHAHALKTQARCVFFSCTHHIYIYICTEKVTSRLPHLRLLTKPFPIYAHVDKLMDRPHNIRRYLPASGRSRGSLHVHARSLYIYWFNLGQGKTALRHMHTHTARRALHQRRDEMFQKQCSCAGNLQRNSLFYYILYVVALRNSFMSRWRAFRYNVYILQST